MFETMETHEEEFIIEQKIHPIHNENFVDVKSCDLPFNHNQDENELESTDPLTSVKEETIEDEPLEDFESQDSLDDEWTMETESKKKKKRKKKKERKRKRNKKKWIGRKPLSIILGDPEVTPNIHCKSCNLPKKDTQNYSTDLR